MRLNHPVLAAALSGCAAIGFVSPAMAQETPPKAPTPAETEQTPAPASGQAPSADTAAEETSPAPAETATPPAPAEGSAGEGQEGSGPSPGR